MATTNKLASGSYMELSAVTNYLRYQEGKFGLANMLESNFVEKTLSAGRQYLTSSQVKGFITPEIVRNMETQVSTIIVL